MKRKVILASGSPRRVQIMQELAKELLFDLDILPNDYDEEILKQTIFDPQELVKQLSYQKALATYDQIKNVADEIIVIGGDTIVAFENELLGKPHTAENAKKMLAKLSDKTNQIITGLSIIVKDQQQEYLIQEIGITDVKMKKMTALEIDEYVLTGEPLDKAGAFAIQEQGFKFIDNISGNIESYYGIDKTAVKNHLSKILNS